MYLRTRSAFGVAVAAALLAACGGGGGGGGGSSITPPGGGGLTVTPSAVAINAVGASQRVTVSLAGYSGAFTIDGSACANVATVDQSTAQGPSAAVTITGIGAGQCTLKVAAGGSSQSLSITVTTTTGSLS